MSRLALLLLCAVPAAAQVRVTSLGVSRGPAAPAVFGLPGPAWREPMGKLFLGEDPLLALPGLESGRPDVVQAALSPALLQLEASGVTPEAFAALPTVLQAQRLTTATTLAQGPLRAELDRLEKELAALPEGDPRLPAVAARLQLLAGPYKHYLDVDRRERAAGAAMSAESKLADEKRRESMDAATRMALALSLDGAPSAAPAAAAVEPSYRRPTLGYRLKVGTLKAKARAREAVVMPVYRGLLYRWHVKVPFLGVEAPLNFKGVMEEAGKIYRAYLSGREMDRNNHRWWFLKELHSNGKISGAFGSSVHPGTFEVMSRVISQKDVVETIKKQAITIGGLLTPAADFVRRPVVNAVDSISGMSFPQLTGRAHMSLLYIHLKLAKELGLRNLYNTGEGGPGFALSMLEGDRDKLRDAAIRWNLEKGRVKPGSWDEAALQQEIDEYMELRNRLFAEFTPDDLLKAQVVAQFGSALNGVRGEGDRVDFAKLREIAASPYVAMTQFKLKQAAKRGSKVDPKKVTDLVAAFRDLSDGKHVKSPEINPDFSSNEEIIALILATRLVTKKPVSLKFGVGSVKDAYEFLEMLRDHGALPDHIQIDGRGKDFSPGSGNAPPDANTSLPADEAVIALHASLKKLGVRESVLLDATGDIRLPSEGVKMLTLGADLISMARGWMVKALGCALVRACNSGSCPYGIAAGGFFTHVLDPLEKGPQGFLAAADWADSYARKVAEIPGVKGWLRVWQGYGLEASPEAGRQTGEDGHTWSLQEIYDRRFTVDLLRPIMNEKEVERYVYGRE